MPSFRQAEQSSAEFRRYGLALKFDAEVGRALMESTLPTLSHKREKDGAARRFRQANFKITAWAETLEEAV